MRTVFDIYDEELVKERMPTPHQLLKTDDDRDYALRKMYDLIRYYSDYRYDTAKEKAAKHLKAVFKQYGTGSAIARRPQDTQTAIINFLLQKLGRDTEQQHIATIGLTEVMTALATSNKIFDREQLLRRNLQSEYVTEVVQNARRELQGKLMEFVDLVNALSLVEGQEKYVKLKQSMNTMVQEYVAAMRQRAKKKEVELK